MVKLLVIVDDFTGALDTGIQFAKRGIRTQIFTECRPESRKIKKDTEVLVVDTESRPMSPDDAYRVVNETALWAVEMGASLIFKKTDSALRGNIGAELQAVADAQPGHTLYFLPAYPEIDRITVDGTQYIQGRLLQDSVFGNDPFEPTTLSYIPDIIRTQSEIPVICLGGTERAQTGTDWMKGQQIAVCDVATAEDMDRRVEELLGDAGLKLVAGCAALADCLAEKLSFHRTIVKKFRKTDSIYIACGSLNKITEEQVEYAENKGGFVRRHLTMEQKLSPAYYSTSEGKRFLDEICSNLQTEKKMIVDTFDIEEEKEKYLHGHNVAKEDVRRLIACAHGCIVREIIERQMDATVLMTGGDTLMGCMRLIGCTQIEPVCEAGQGVVVSMLEWNGRRQQVISKSGGFGTVDILCKTAQKILKENI